MQSRSDAHARIGSYMQRKPKVLFVSTQPVLHNGRVAKLGRTLRDEGFDVRVLSVTQHRDHSPDAALRLHNIRVPNPSGSSVRRYLRHFKLRLSVAQVCRRLLPDLIIAIDLASLDLANRGTPQNLPIIFDACEAFDGLAGANEAQARYARIAIRRAMPRISATITVSTYLREHYLRLFPHLPQPYIVTNAPDRQTERKSIKRLRAHIGIGRDIKICLYHGGFAPHRGLEYLVSTADHLPGDYVLVLMGTGRIASALKKMGRLSDKRCGRKVVYFLAPVPNSELLDWVEGANLGLIPYEPNFANHSICTPNKLYEYGFANVPIIATRLGALSNILTDYGIGKVIDRVGGQEITDMLAGTPGETIQAWADNCNTFKLEEAWDNSRRSFLSAVGSALKSRSA